jgi:hypothetical protein
MNAEEFVRAIQSEVQEPTAQGLIELLEQPPGRKPRADVMALSQWYNALSHDDQQRLREVVQMTSRDASLRIPGGARRGSSHRGWT